MDTPVDTFYEEKKFDGKMWYRTSPGGAYRPVIPPKEYAARRGYKQRISTQNTPIDILLNDMQQMLELRSRGALLKAMHHDHPQITRMRSGKQEITANFMLSIHYLTGWDIPEIRERLGLPEYVRKKFNPDGTEAVTTETV